jgi:hypothetical protein
VTVEVPVAVAVKVMLDVIVTVEVTVTVKMTVAVTARGKLPLNSQINGIEHIKPFPDLFQPWLLQYALDTMN